jgi:hypothetical protein
MVIANLGTLKNYANDNLKKHMHRIDRRLPLAGLPKETLSQVKPW